MTTTEQSKLVTYSEDCDLTLKEKQAWPLEVKVEQTRQRIREWVEHWGGKVFISNSGGRDSSVLAHIVMDLYPDTPNVFLNTGLEFPEIVRHVETFPNLIKLQPAKPFIRVIREDGYPILGKKIAKGLHWLLHPTEKNRASRHFAITGIRRDGKKSARILIAKKWAKIFNAHENELGWQIKSPFEIHNKCCDFLKKKPSERYLKSNKVYPFIGSRAEEGGPRREAYNKKGCNRYSGSISSNPLSFWTHEDILEYIKQNNVKIAEVYGMGYERTGCVFCMFGVHLEKEPNRFQLLKQTHPKLWHYCMDKLDLRTVLNYINVPTGD